MVLRKKYSEKKSAYTIHRYKFCIPSKGSGLKIFGIPENKRAADIHVIPKLAGITSVLMGVSYASALRRHSFTFEEFYKTTIFTGFGGAVMAIALGQTFFMDYFHDGAKYNGNRVYAGADPYKNGNYGIL